YNISDYFLLADEVETLSSIVTLSSINLSHSIFESVANSSLTFSSTVSFFTISFLISIFLQIIADSFILKISVLSVLSIILQIYNHSSLSYIISNQIYKNLSRFLIS
ncbi:hypothetical protein EMPG_12586, partial [Blastomyces silverae]